MLSKQIFRKYDIRGIFEQDLTLDAVKLIAKSLATILIRRKISKISLGRDGRRSSPQIFHILSDEFIKYGLEIFDIGIVPSPMLYFSIYHLKTQAGIMITASHNPKEYNGIKIMLKDEAFYGEKIENLHEICIKSDFEPYPHLAGSIKNIDISDDYVEKITQNIDKSSRVNFCFDAGNGSAGDIVKKIASKLNISNEKLLYCDIDGDFPNHHPDPTLEKNMQDLSNLVKKHNSDAGFGLDGDGDRLGIVDNLGRFVYGDVLMCILSEFLLKEAPGSKIISDVKASKILFEHIKNLGGKPIIWQTGHSLIKEKIKIENANLAGEMSGHIFYNDRYFGFDDGLYAAMRIVEIVQKYQLNIADFIDKLPKTFLTPDVKIEIPEEEKFKKMQILSNNIKQNFKNILDIDGLRVELENGWFLIRASNTQNCLIARCEAENLEDLEKIKQILLTELKKVDILFDF